MERNHPFILMPKKKHFSRLAKVFNSIFVVFLLFGLLYATAALFFPANVPTIQSLVTQQSNGQSPQKGVLGFLIAQAGPTATPTIGPSPTPAPPTATPTPTPIPTAVLSGTVFNDVDLDTTKDSSEAVMANVVITITGSTNTSVTTNASGAYSVTLPKGTYTLTMTVPSGYKSTSTNPRSVNLNANTAANFGLAKLFTFSGNVYVDTNISLLKDTIEVGFPGATVSVSGPTPSSTTTDINGNFTLQSLVEGTYIVTVTVPGGYKATTANPVSVNLNGNLSTSFGIAQVYNVTGNVFLDNNRNAVDDTGDGNYTGATVTFTGVKTITARTDANGSYTAQLFAGTYTATLPLPANYQNSTPLSQNVTVGPNGTLNFGLIPIFTISGRIFEDKNEDGKEGNGDSVEKDVTVTLSGAGTATTVTDNNGEFSFPNLYAGNYAITYVLPAKKKSTTTTTQNISFAAPTTAGSGGAPTVEKSVAFGMVTLYNVVGKVFIDLNKDGVLSPSEPLYQGAKVTLTKNTPTSQITDVGGSYNFLDQGAGNYTIALDTPTGYRSTTANSLNFSLAADRIFNFGILESTTTKVGGECSANGVDIVIVFDDSGSMQDYSPTHGTTKFIAAQRAASSFIDIVSSHVKNAEYGLVIFSGSDNYPNNSLTRVSQQLTKSAASMKTAIANVPTNGGGTCVECGITLANSELSKSIRNAQKVVIVMTDGATNQTIQSNGGTVSEDVGENATMNAAINGVNGQNIIYQVIGIGEGAAEFDPVFMQQIADTNGGTFYATSTQSTLEAIYQSIAEDIGTGIVNGVVFNDKNTNRVYDTGDAPLENWTLNATASGLTIPITTRTDASGKYSFTGLCSKDFIFTQELQDGWYQTTDNTSYFIPVESGNTYNNNDFGNAIGFTISGNIFNDFDRNSQFAPPDELFTGDMAVLFSGPTRKLVTTNDGKYNSGTIPPGTYNVSLVSPLTTGYRMSYPLNGPPPSFQVTIGVNCDVNGAIGAVCN